MQHSGAQKQNTYINRSRLIQNTSPDISVSSILYHFKVILLGSGFFQMFRLLYVLYCILHDTPHGEGMSEIWVNVTFRV